jgi:ribosomal protein S27AE
MTKNNDLPFENINERHPDYARIIVALQRDQCPDCGQLGFDDGPRGGAGINLFCSNCGSGFNVALPRAIMTAQRIPRKPVS